MNLIESRRATNQNRGWYFVAILPGAWAIFGSRWGSYLPKEPFFFSDLLICLLVASTILSNVLVKRRNKFNLYLFFSFYLVFELLMSDWVQPITSLRDFLPYFYLTVAPLMAIRFISAGDAMLARFGILLQVCIVLHTFWCVASFFIPQITLSLPIVSAAQSLHIFSIRPDFDAVITSVFIAMVILNRINIIPRKIQYLLVLVGSAYIILQNNRASFISFVLLILLASRSRIKLVENIDLKGLLKIAGFSMATISIVIISQLSIGQKFIGTINADSTNASAQAGAGTASARLSAWKLVFDFIDAKPQRLAFGTGFGNDYLQDSGALRALVNSEEGSRTSPRHPHNYWINSYARLGLVGIATLFLLFSQGLRRSFRVFKNHSSYGDATLISALIFISIIPVASLGVVLESPFGAISMSMSLAFMLAVAEKEKA